MIEVPLFREKTARRDLVAPVLKGQVPRVFDADRLLYRSTLGLRVIKQKKKRSGLQWCSESREKAHERKVSKFVEVLSRGVVKEEVSRGLVVFSRKKRCQQRASEP